ncbi:MAG: hypothetical protein ABNH16_08840 [Thalassolituus sp.]|jgi:teichuronic acid biosynthesis glycosyltransferase TuaH
MKILLLSHASLATGFIVGSHQLARQFSIQGHDVYHVSSPVSVMNLLKSATGLRKLKVSLFEKNIIHEHWLVKDHIPFLPFPLGYNKLLDKINSFIIYKYLKKIYKEDFDLILVDQPLFYSVLKFFRESKIIYRPTDIYGDMGGPRFDRAEAQILNYTNSVIATNLNILKIIKDKHNVKNSITLNNGVDLEFFNRTMQENTHRAGVIYVGAIDFRFDLTFVLNLAKANPNLQFDIYGPIEVELPQSLPKNLSFLGAVGYLQLPKLMQKYSYGLMPFNNHPSNKGRSPMKLWEYYAAGLKIVAKIHPDNEIAGLPNALYVNLNHTGENLIITESPTSQEMTESITVPSWSNISKQIIDFSSKLPD